MTRTYPLLSYHPQYSDYIVLSLQYSPYFKALLISIVGFSPHYTSENVIYLSWHFQHQLNGLEHGIYLTNICLMNELHDSRKQYQIYGFNWIFIDNQHLFYEFLVNTSNVLMVMFQNPFSMVSCIYSSPSLLLSEEMETLNDTFLDAWLLEKEVSFLCARHPS